MTLQVLLPVITYVDKHYLTFLLKELKRRKGVNGRYSLRAFAKHLNVDPGALSRILSGKQNLSVKLALEIMCALPMQAHERELFLASLMEEKQQQLLERVTQMVASRYPKSENHRKSSD